MEIEEKYIKNNNNINNNISDSIKNFSVSFDNLVLNLIKISKTLNQQIICSNNLIKEIMIEKIYSEKLVQLYNRIGMLEDSRQLMQRKIRIIYYEIKKFLKEIKNYLNNENKDNKINNINIKEINNNYQYKTLFNYGFYNMKNFKTKFKSKQNLNNSTKIRKKFDIYMDINKNNFFGINKKSRNLINNKTTNLENSASFNNNIIKINATSKNNNFNINLNLEEKEELINKNNIFNSNNEDAKIINNNNNKILANNVIQFLRIINEMKTKYNNKKSKNDIEFKKIKFKYDNLKLYIMKLSKKILSNINENKNKFETIKYKNIDKEDIKESNDEKNDNKSKIIINSFNNLLIENKDIFSYIINQNKTIINLLTISKEISINYIKNPILIIKFLPKIIHENNFFILKENDALKSENFQLEKKIKELEEELLKYKDNDKNKLLDESKVLKDNKEQIDLLLNESQDLKNELEEMKDNFNISNYSNSKEEMDKYYKELIKEYESKIKFYEEKNKFNEKEINDFKKRDNNSKENMEIVNLKIENSNIQKELKNLKMENSLLNQKLKEYNIINNIGELSPEKYDIIYEKNFENLNLCWILLKEKNKEENKYESYFWIGKNIEIDLYKFNYIKENDAIKQQIVNYITQLEEKDEIIDKLKQKLKRYEK